MDLTAIKIMLPGIFHIYIILIYAHYTNNSSYNDLLDNFVNIDAVILMVDFNAHHTDWNY